MPAARAVIPNAITTIIITGSNGAQNKSAAMIKKLNPIPAKTVIIVLRLCFTTTISRS